MKSTMIAVALIGAAVSFNADAALHCKNDLGQTLLYQVNQAKPDTSPGVFDISGPRNIVCLLSSYVYYQMYPQISGVPNIAGIPSGGLDGDGIIVRGDTARFVIENIAATNGRPATKAQYDAAKP